MAGTSANAPRSEPKLALLVMCVECGEGVEAPLPIEHQALTLLLAQRGWYLTRLPPPVEQGPEVPILTGALCAACAPKVLAPEILQMAERQRQHLLAGVP